MDRQAPDLSESESEPESEGGSRERSRSDRWSSKESAGGSDPKSKNARNVRSAAALAASEAERLGPWSARNTLLLDDSSDKARLQPFNHLLVPEFDAERARAVKAHQRRKDGRNSRSVDREMEMEGKEKGKRERERGAARRAGRSGTQEPESEARPEPEQDQETAQGQEQEHEPDDVLLQAIGVLEHLRWQSNVAAWIRAGGLDGFGAPRERARTDADADTAEDEPGTAKGARRTRTRTSAYWAAEGRRVLKRYGIAATTD